MKSTFGFVEYQVIETATIVICKASSIRRLIINAEEKSAVIFRIAPNEPYNELGMKITYESGCALRGLLTSMTLESQDEKLSDLRIHP